MAITTLNASDSGSTSRTVINDNFAQLAPLASPTFTGTPTLPTGTIAVTQTAGDSSTKIATTAFVAGLNTVETTTGTTHSLTTTVGQRVIVWVKGSFTGSASLATITLSYNGIVKDTTLADTEASGTDLPFALMYTETPGAATQNITVATDTGSISNVVIIVLKL